MVCSLLRIETTVTFYAICIDKVVYSRSGFRGARLDYRISIIGLFVGFLVGLTGMGGGALLAPILILFLRVPPVWAVGTDIAYSAVTKALGSIIPFQQKSVNRKTLKIAL